MLYKCLYLFFFLNVILTAQVTRADSTLIKNPKTAFYLSVVPGVGQLYNGKLLKGSLVFALESFAIYSWLENAKIYRDYDSIEKPLPKNRYLEKRNKYAWWVIFIYFYSMIDAMVDAHLSPFDQIMNTAIEDKKGESNE
ncbi:hypothetical protein EVA24_04760 [bacterium]|nr:MAG: hypothetical protein EVA24_04760 [bacterium]